MALELFSHAFELQRPITVPQSDDLQHPARCSLGRRKRLGASALLYGHTDKILRAGYSGDSGRIATTGVVFAEES